MTFFQSANEDLELLAPKSASLIESLKQNDASLTELCGFGYHTIDEISTALRKNTTVTSFKLSNCELHDDDCAAIMNALTIRYAYQAKNLCVTCRPRTKRISLARNQIGRDGAQHIARFVGSPSICHKELDKDAPVHFRKAICKNCGKDRLISPRFREDFIRLDLLSNEIGDEGVATIAHAMATFDRCNSDNRSHYIVELGCERNSISDIGMYSICEMIKTNSSLITLHLGKNDITKASMTYLSDALKHNKTLETLSLTGNRAIGDEGVLILIQSLRYNTTLTTLLLKKCGIIDIGTNHLIRALYCDTSPGDVIDNSNHTLVEISLCSQYVCNYLAMNKLSLRTLLGWNKLGAATARRLKLGFYLCSDRGIRHVHSLGLEREIFPLLLNKLWKIFRDDFNRRPVNKLDILFRYVQGMVIDL